MSEYFIDPGYGFTKAIDNSDRNNDILRPSAYAAMPSGISENELGLFTSFGDYIFGESALTLSALPQRFQYYEGCLSDGYLANLLMTIVQMNKGNVIDCELVLSLPFNAMYLSQKLIERVTGSYEVKRLGGKKQTINITFPDKWAIMPQNAAPAFATLDLKNIKRDGEIWIAVGNAGSHTFEYGTFGIDLDTLTLRPGVKAQQDTQAKGMYTLANEIRPLLIEHFRGKLTSFDQYKIFKILLTGLVEVANTFVDVSELIEPKKQEYLQAIEGYCRQIWSKQNGLEIGEIYQFCLSGGGAHIVQPHLESVNFHDNIAVSDKPQFDVVRGSMNWHKLIGE